MAEFAAALVAASVGAMLFFSAVVAPTVFRAIPADHAGTFLRAVFPIYFAVNGGAAIAAALLVPFGWPFWMLLACGLTMFAIVVLAIPAINAARDQALAGDRDAQRTFGLLHGATVAANVAQLAVMSGAAYLLLSGPQA